MKKITVLTPCYNEEENVESLHAQVKAVFATLGKYEFEHVFIDNASADGTVSVLRRMASQEPSVKVIVNTRNFGHIRSPFYGLLQTSGDATILMAADHQDPPELIVDFVRHWENGFKVVMGVKPASEESAAFFAVRKLYYDFVARISDVRLVKNATGFGLYDRVVIEQLRNVEDPYPYFRGLICELGYEVAQVPFKQPLRKRGITSNNFYTLYDIAMLGITNHSKVPLRLATMLGFASAIFSFLVAFGYFVAKLLFWNEFQLGIAPLVIGLFLFSSVQLFFIGMIGEYIGSIHTQVLKRPLVIEKERINF